MYLLPTFALLGAAQAILMPSPPGPYNVAVRDIELIDSNRIDAFAPEPNTKRRIMVSAYLPIDAKHNCKPQVVPYMPALTASVFGELGASLGIPNGTIESFEMEFCNISTIKSSKSKKEFPVVIFSPGAQGTRLVWGAVARSLASLGYIVFTLDHTYETLVVEFPDGSAAYHTTDDTPDLVMLEARTKDASFLTSQLSNKTLTNSIFANFPGTFNPERVAIYGHSFGGSTAAVTVQRDPRIIGGLGLDAPIYGSVNHEGFKDKPFILVAADRSDPFDWDEFYSKIDGPKMVLEIMKTQHYAFTDVPLMLTKIKIPKESQGVVDEIFGTLDGRKLEKATNQILVGWMDLLFKKKTGTLKKVGRNVNVKVLRSDLVKQS
ncbi:Alpha/Beta hydrolase protein [Fusarium flagelliforme]|uniref:Alpha/Beta hydrolase protein n=1 Tax=Fusarium flagelliforme TaxID=2675880 RepID=UPI001E8CBACF|nr:Alpha/Beta hydrolase protein [Fusarium flagelliforme]KAH7191768.1 Alpha/Beta hydrolase protein [Fusarium flagelliforme]